ncbi:MAG: purine-binding chemotaxis protein CheW [Ignavibacteria bacterium]|nr:purine-binding chemotaxis protein CheW [Ignavibacteria bacterium]MBL7990652.1 purine-binding chemotaxis protein CheW [Candidatus Kapabacteria bacterium]
MKSQITTALEAFADDEDINTLIHKFIVFRLGREEYALEAQYVNEIVGMQHITVVPNVQHYIKGVINLRGKIIPVVDVRLRFGLEETVYNDRTCIIITQHDAHGATGLIVDAVVEVVDIDDSSISEPPKTGKGSQSHFLQGMAKHGDIVRMIVNIGSILADEEISLQ